jgi:hypothetical protein
MNHDTVEKLSALRRHLQEGEHDYDSALGKMRADLSKLHGELAEIHATAVEHLKHAPDEDRDAFKKLLQALADAVAKTNTARGIIKTSLWSS